MEKGCIAVLGMFDGVHVGHQALLQRARELKENSSLPIVVVTFTVHPKSLFGTCPPLLTDNKQKERLCLSFGADRVVFLEFDEQMRTMPPQQFVKNYLINCLDARYVVVGEDYRFGYRHQGTAQTLTQYQEFQTEILSSVCMENEPVSSSRIRTLLQQGDLDTALRCLGHPLEVEGIVEQGRGVGRTLGFPTANISGVFPPFRYGVYLTQTLTEGEWIPGISNFGVLPTFGEGQKAKLETHLFDFEKNLYHQKVAVRFLKFVREERKFDSSAELTQTVHTDIQQAKQYFADLL